jgi:hypothetical protein
MYTFASVLCIQRKNLEDYDIFCRKNEKESRGSTYDNYHCAPKREPRERERERERERDPIQYHPHQQAAGSKLVGDRGIANERPTEDDDTARKVRDGAAAAAGSAREVGMTVPPLLFVVVDLIATGAGAGASAAEDHRHHRHDDDDDDDDGGDDDDDDDVGIFSRTRIGSCRTARTDGRA